MKNKIFLMLVTTMALAACASPVKYNSADTTSEGVRVTLGSKNGLSVGDKIRVFEKDCSPDGRSRSCHYKTVGFMTVKKVENDSSAIAKPDTEFSLGDNTYYEKENTCTGKKTKLDKGC